MAKLLIANRGEIACRIIRSARSLGLSTVAVYSEADAQALHVASADEALPIGPSTPQESYLSFEKIIAACKASGATALHPGYGFLAENATFARAVEREGLIFVGPHPDSIDQMGNKASARATAQRAGIPVLPGSRRFALGDCDGIEAAAAEVGYPLLVKAAAGGGGIGMRRVDQPEDLLQVVASTQSLAARAFGDGSAYLERFVPNARHVEVQVFGFGNGAAVHLYERDCSLQRRFQKVVEESPGPGLSQGTRRAMWEAATALARAVSYRGAGTVEFVVDVDTSQFYFLEMNTRIQVEHPVTEMVTGIDLIAWQLQLAFGSLTEKHGAPLPSMRGHAIECRVYAEDPGRNFLPSPGKLTKFVIPEGMPDVRVDTGVRQGDQITPFYDPMIAKVICWAEDRTAAIAKSLQALEKVEIEGVSTNLQFLRAILAHEGFRAGDLNTGFLTENAPALNAAIQRTNDGAPA